MSTDTAALAGIIQPNDQASIAAFEKNFYTAYRNIAQQKLIRQIWDWNDEEERISLRCPLTAANIFVWKENGKPSFYVLGTLDRTVFSQLAYYGFQKPEDVGHYGEVFSIHKTANLTTSLFEIRKKFMVPYCYEFAKEQGASHLLATCSPAMLPLYKRWDWEVLESKTIDGEIRFFIKLAL